MCHRLIMGKCTILSRNLLVKTIYRISSSGVLTTCTATMPNFLPKQTLRASNLVTFLPWTPIQWQLHSTKCRISSRPNNRSWCSSSTAVWSSICLLRTMAWSKPCLLRWLFLNWITSRHHGYNRAPPAQTMLFLQLQLRRTRRKNSRFRRDHKTTR